MAGNIFSKKKTDLTQGPVFSGLITFALPVLLGTIVSQFYNLADSVIVGQFVSADALSAVSATSPIHTFMNLFFISLSTGTVVVSHHVGEGDREGIQKAVGTIACMVLLCGAFLVAVGLIFSKAALAALGTPENILEDAAVYCRIVFIGVLGNLAYQMGNGVLRSMGDSRWPFYFLLFCCVLNFLLDLLFVLVFHWGVFGVALATSVSQFVSAIGIIRRINKGPYPVTLSWKCVRLDSLECKRIINIGLPAAIQNVGNSIAAVFVQTSVNYFGNAMIASNSIVTKIDDFINIPVTALSAALCTFVGQNMGGYHMDRIKTGIRDSILTLEVLGVFMTAGLIFGRNLLPMVFTSDKEVISMTATGVFIMSFQCLFHGIDRVLVNAMRGAGKSVVPMITAQFGAFSRIPLAYFLGVCRNDYKGIFWALLIASLLRTIAIACYYYCGGWKKAVRKFEESHQKKNKINPEKK